MLFSVSRDFVGGDKGIVWNREIESKSKSGQCVKYLAFELKFMSFMPFF